MKASTLLLALLLLASCAKEELTLEETATTETENIEEEEQSDTSEEPDDYRYLFTDQAKNTLRIRFENDYITGIGFSSDFLHIKENLPSFMTNPGEFRPLFGSSSIISSQGEILHMAGLYAYVMDDVNVANTVAQEILATFIDNDLDDPFWSTSPNFSTDNGLFVQTAKIKKLKDSYYFVKELQNVLTEDEQLIITNWLARYKDLVWAWAEPRFEGYFGSNWQDGGVTTFNPEGLYPSGVADPFPLQDSEGNDLTNYGMAWAQNHFNNRAIDNITFMHSWAVSNDDMNLEHYCREYLKNAIRYGTFSDGTFWELIRNHSGDNTQGVFYTNITLTGLVYMAHIDAMNNHFPGDMLYDFKTTDGIIQGSTNLTTNPYAGGSTTDGVTEKSLKTLILGQSKYLRTEADGGWSDLRFNNGESMSTVNKRQNSVIAAIANLYYKDQDLEDYYSYNTSVGYPEKVTIYEGWAGNEDYGAWGNFIIGGAWMEQEVNFF